MKDGKVSKLRPASENRKGCDFSYFFSPPAALATPSIQKTAPGWENTMAVKDGKVSKLAPLLLLLLLPPAGWENCSEAPAAAPALATPSIQKTAPGWENTMAVKDGKVSKLRPKTS